MVTRFISKGKGRKRKAIPISPKKKKGVSVRSVSLEPQAIQKINKKTIKTLNTGEPANFSSSLNKLVITSRLKRDNTVRKKREQKLDLFDIQNYDVDFYQERDNATVTVTRKSDDKTVWSNFDPKELSELIEDGFFSWDDKDSVLQWLADNGTIESTQKLREELRFAKVGSVTKIADLKLRSELKLLAGDKVIPVINEFRLFSVKDIEEEIGKKLADTFNGFYVWIESGEFSEVWGFKGTVDPEEFAERLI